MTRDLETLKTEARADVYKAGVFAATLHRRDHGIEFAYRPDYVIALGPAVATSLPLSVDVVTTPSGAVPAFFAGLLPEGRRLSGLGRALKTSADDELSLLLAVGGDPVGDVQVVVTGTQPGQVTPLIQIERAWSAIRFSDVLGESGIIDPVAPHRRTRRRTACRSTALRPEPHGRSRRRTAHATTSALQALSSGPAPSSVSQQTPNSGYAVTQTDGEATNGGCEGRNG